MPNDNHNNEEEDGASSSLWSPEDIRLLLEALKHYSSSLEKNERFRQVAKAVGGGHSKRDCYDQYKKLKAIKKKKRQKEQQHQPRQQRQQSQKTRYSQSSREERTDSTAIDEYEYREDRNSSSRQDEPGRRGSVFNTANEESANGPINNGRRKSSDITNDRLDDGSIEKGRQARGRGRRTDTAEEMSRCEEKSMDWSNGKNHHNGAGGGGAGRGGGRGEEHLRLEDLADFEEETDAYLDGFTSQSSRSNRRQEQRGKLMDGDDDCCGDDDGAAHVRGVGITQDEAISLRKVLFCDSKKTFNDAWMQQGFTFSKQKDLRFGLVQREGGPCGVLAVVQGFLLDHLLFPGEEKRKKNVLNGHRGDKGTDSSWQTLGSAEREAALVSALATIVWRAGQCTRAVVVVPQENNQFDRSTTSYKPDRFTERLMLFQLHSLSAIRSLIRRNINTFTRGSGVVLIVYSAILSRGTAGILSDMDSGFPGAAGDEVKLMANHGYAAQELVNLLLVGRAYSNVFDGDMVMDDGGPQDSGGSGSDGDRILLKGIPSKGRVGFLTLFETYNHMQVGRYLKCAASPVWVICSESHYSVLFSPVHLPASRPIDNRNANRQRKNGNGVGGGDAVDGEVMDECFDLFYYDGLDNQDHLIRLTVDCHPAVPPACISEDDDEDVDGRADLIPPIDLVIRTKWKGAAVDWNDSEPIL